MFSFGQQLLNCGSFVPRIDHVVFEEAVFGVQLLVMEDSNPVRLHAQVLGELYFWASARHFAPHDDHRKPNQGACLFNAFLADQLTIIYNVGSLWNTW